MIMTCELCGNDFLTEADPYVIQNTHQGQKYYCSCMISNHNQISSIDKLQAENKKLRDALEFYADSTNYSRKIDYKGLHYVSPIGERFELGEDNGRLARKVLKELGKE